MTNGHPNILYTMAPASRPGIPRSSWPSACLNVTARTIDHLKMDELCLEDSGLSALLVSTCVINARRAHYPHHSSVLSYTCDRTLLSRQRRFVQSLVCGSVHASISSFCLSQRSRLGSIIWSTVRNENYHHSSEPVAIVSHGEPRSMTVGSQTYAAVAEKTSILLASVKILNRQEKTPVNTTTKTILIKSGFTK